MEQELSMELLTLDNEEKPPLCVEETVNTLIQKFNKPESLNQDLLFAFLLMKMEQNEFQLFGDTKSDKSTILDYILLMKRTKSFYEAVFVLKGHENLTVKLVMTPLSDIVLINATILEICSETYSICLPVKKYFVQCNTLSNKNFIPKGFTNTAELSNKLKDKIIAPIKSTILNYNRSPGCALTGLPTEILQLILLRLPIKDVLSLSESCKRMNDIINEDCLWAHFYDRDFPEKSKNTDKGWKELYKEVYLRVKKERSRLLSTIRSTDSIRRENRIRPRVPSSPDSLMGWEVIL